MAEVFNGTVKVIVDALLEGDLDLGTGRHKIDSSYSTVLANGTAANQASQMWSDTRTITASANDDLDLAGVLTNAFGSTITFTSVKAIVVRAATANTNDVIIGGSATNPFETFLGGTNPSVTVVPGGSFSITSPEATGFVVTAATGDILRLTNAAGGTSVVYDIIIIGEE